MALLGLIDVRSIIKKAVRSLFRKCALFRFGLFISGAFLFISGAALHAFATGPAVHAEEIIISSYRGSTLVDPLSASCASAVGSLTFLECKPAYVASTGEHERMESGGGPEDIEVAAMELDLSSSGTRRGEKVSTPTHIFRCAETTPVTGALTGAGMINLFVSLGIVTVETAMKACESLTRETVSTVTSSDAGFPFPRPLAEGMVGDDVRRLQRFLNAQGFVISEEGSGSPGNETDVFGALTVDAVKRYQAVYSDEILDPEGLSAPSGLFGPRSIKKANEILSAHKPARPNGHQSSTPK